MSEHTIDFKYSPSIMQTCIGRVDDEHKTIVREDGSLNYDFQGESIDLEEQLEKGVYQPPGPHHEPTRDTLHFQHRLKPTFTHEDELIERYQEYGDPSEAIVTTVEDYEDTTFSWTAFAYENAEGLRADIIRYTLEASEDFGYAPSRVEFSLQGEREGLPEILESRGVTDYWTTEAFQYRQEATHYEFLEANETREGALVVVLEGNFDPEEVTVEWADEALEATQEYWAEVEPFQNEIAIPDDDVMAMLESSGRNILQAREEIDGVTEYQVGPTHYRGLWVVDGHFLLEAAHLMGRGDEAFEQGILSLLQRVRPDGSIQILSGHEKETGIALATFVRQCELADADERLEELWPTMLRSLSFLEDIREEAKEMEDYPGIFPPAFLDGGIGGLFPEYTTPLWILVGLKYAAEAGERLDLPEYERFRALYEDVWEGFVESAERDMKETEEGIPYIPMNMEEREGYDRPQSATWAFAHAIYPGEVFDPGSEYVQNLLALLDSVDDTQGIPEETGWLHDQAVWPYSAMFYAQAFLYAGRPEKAVDYLYAFANHAAPSRVWREEISFANSHAMEFIGDMPHNWASAEFIRMVRNLLVFEREDTLELLVGLPDEWLPNGDETLILKETPTRYGPVDITLTESVDDTFCFQLEMGQGNQRAEHVILHWSGSIVESSSEYRLLDDGRVELLDPQDGVELELTRSG